MKENENEEYIDEDDPLFIKCNQNHKFAITCKDFLNKRYEVPCPVCAGWKEGELYRCSPNDGETWFFTRQWDKHDK